MQAAVPGAVGVPVSATGGEALPQAVASLHNLRTIIQGVYDAPVRFNAENVAILPDIGYSKAYRIYFTGTLDVTPGTGTVTAGDPRKLIRNLGYFVMTSTRIHELPGVAENFLNNLDFKVIPSKQNFTVNAGSNQFYMEFVLFLPFSERKMAGLIYKGGGSTYATLRAVLGGAGDILTATGNATAVFSSLNMQVREERIDAEAPQNPRRVQTQVNGRMQETLIPGRGLWQETSRFIETVVDQEVNIAGANREIPVDMQLGLPYLRILLISYLNGNVDSGDTMLSGWRLEFENTTTTWDFNLNESDRVYREMYRKNRPGGLHVISFRDKTDSDRDTLYTRDLGRFAIILKTAATAPATPNPLNQVQVVVQRVRYLNEAARY